MATAAEIRLANLEILIAEAGTLEETAARVDSSSVYLSQIRNGAKDLKSGRPRELGTRMARRLESAFGKAVGWMDVPHQAPATIEELGATIADSINSLGAEQRKEALDYIRYKLERSNPPLAHEDLQRYLSAFDALGRAGTTGQKSH